MNENARPALTRRTLLIDREFQLKYAGLLLFAGVLISLAFAVMTYLMHVDGQRNLALLTGAEQRPMDPLAIAMLVLAVALAGGAMGLLGLLVTHRIAGPVYVMTHYVSALAKGSFPPIRPLRRNDELKRFFERFQGALESLKAQQAEEALALSDAIALLRNAPQTSETKAVLDSLSALHARKRAALESRATPIGSA